MLHPWRDCKPCQGTGVGGEPCRKFAAKGERFCGFCRERVMRAARLAGYFTHVEDHKPTGPPMRARYVDEAASRDDAIRAMEDR